MPRAGLALGSNLGDRMENLRGAIRALEEIHRGDIGMCRASIYQTEPLFCPPGSPLFYNTVVEIGFEGSAEELLQQTQAIEKRLGRTRGPERNAPRVIDVDILYFGTESLQTPALELPHPRLGERRFVLQPLAEIRPDLILAGSPLTIQQRLDGLVSGEPPLRRVSPTD